jgi:hypothetical protein
MRVEEPQRAIMLAGVRAAAAGVGWATSAELVYEIDSA